MTKKAVIIGAAGQDGKLLTEHLGKLEYEILPVTKSSGPNILSSQEVSSFIKQTQPGEVYYLAAFHHSSEEKITDECSLWEKSHQINVQGYLHFLEACRLGSPNSRLFYASSSQIFGKATETPLNENSKMAPNTAYGISKLAGMLLGDRYRKEFDIFTSSGILFNHESEYRPSQFLSKKVVKSAVKIQRGQLKQLELGNLEATVDWGDAQDYVAAMRAILNAQAPSDFVIASGKGRTVRNLVSTVFGLLGLDWQDFVAEKAGILKRDFSPLIGNCQKLKQKTGWAPQSSFESLLKRMLVKEGGVLCEKN